MNITSMLKNILTIILLFIANMSLAQTYVVCEVTTGNTMSPDGTLRQYAEQPTVLTFDSDGGITAFQTRGCTEVRELSNGTSEVVISCADNSGVVTNLQVNRITGYWEKSTVFSTGAVISVEGQCSGQQARRF